MGRIVGLLPGGEMAAGVAAVSGLNRQIVISAYVALRAGCDLTGGSHLVGIGQWKAC